MTQTIRTLRTLVGLAAVATLTAVAEAQPPQDSSASQRRTTTTASAGTVEREARAPRTARRASAMRGEPRAHPRDYVGADDPRCDDLCERERMMDAKYGKDRERLPGARRP